MAIDRSLLRLIPLVMGGLPLGGLVACAQSAAYEDTGFEVVSAVPADGDADVVEAWYPELRLSHQADQTSCTTDTLGLVRLNDDGSVGYELGVDLDFKDTGFKISLQHDELFVRGYTYAYVVRTGSSGCTDLLGRQLRPFHASFYVP